MQASYANGTMVECFRRVVRVEGWLGLYRGLLPPLLGSALFRSTQFAVTSDIQHRDVNILYSCNNEHRLRFAPQVYNSVFSHLGHSQPWSHHALPWSGGLEARVPIAAVASGTARSIVECPLELISMLLRPHHL